MRIFLFSLLFDYTQTLGEHSTQLEDKFGDYLRWSWRVMTYNLMSGLWGLCVCLKHFKCFCTETALDSFTGNGLFCSWQHSPEGYFFSPRILSHLLLMTVHTHRLVLLLGTLIDKMHSLFPNKRHTCTYPSLIMAIIFACAWGVWNNTRLIRLGDLLPLLQGSISVLAWSLYWQLIGISMGTLTGRWQHPLASLWLVYP